MFVISKYFQPYFAGKPNVGVGYYEVLHYGRLRSIKGNVKPQKHASLFWQSNKFHHVIVSYTV